MVGGWQAERFVFAFHDFIAVFISADVALFFFKPAYCPSLLLSHEPQLSSGLSMCLQSGLAKHHVHCTSVQSALISAADLLRLLVRIVVIFVLELVHKLDVAPFSGTWLNSSINEFLPCLALRFALRAHQVSIAAHIPQ